MDTEMKPVVTVPAVAFVIMAAELVHASQVSSERVASTKLL